MKSTIAALSITAALAGAVAGCALSPVEQDEPAAPSPDGVVEDPIGTLVASINFETGHVVRIYEVEPGIMVATESGKIEAQPPRLAQAEIVSYVDLFETLAPDQAVPMALLDAEARREATRAESGRSETPDEALPTKGAGPSFYTTAEQTWFRSTFCPWGTPKCFQFWDGIDSGWDYTTSWKSTVMVGSEGSVAAPHITYWWKCSFGSCWWEPLSSANVSPGSYHWVSSDNGTKFYFKATLDGAGGGTQVSMAISNGPYTCAVCNDGACQCGYNIPDNLCSSHNGVDPAYGCIVQP
jgi:hypothetical protein